MRSTTAMSWLMNRDGDAHVALNIHQQVDDLGLDRNVERGDSLIGDEQSRVERQ
ncbi:hypothetical protein [Mesorhizobium erdmanii]|uniref:hypothetical protein n=1 Tax=Mesorhizobium erdmanii TaxID=1777866 RepID=UPI001FD7C3C4|nr:hypothetical protein [Mesorhizobium erdmanii]